MVVSIAKGVAVAGAAGVALLALGTAATMAGAIVGGVATMIGALTGAIGFLLSPLGLATAALGAGAVAFVRYTEAGQSALSGVSKVFAGLKDAIMSGDLSRAWQIMSTSGRLAFAEIADRAKWTFNDFLPALVRGSVQAIRGMFGAVVEGWHEPLQAFWELFKTGASAAGDFLLQTWVSSIFATAEAADAMWGLMRNSGTAAVMFVMARMQSQVVMMSEIMGAFWKAFKGFGYDAVQNVVASFAEFFPKLWLFVQSGLAMAFENAFKLFGKLGGLATYAFVKVLATGVRSALRGVAMSPGAIENATGSAEVNPAYVTAREATEGPGAFEKLAEHFRSGMRGEYAYGQELAADIARAVADDARRAVQAGEATGGAAIGRFESDLADAISDHGDRIAQAGRNAAQRTRSSAADFARSVADYGRSIAGAAGAGADGLRSNLPTYSASSALTGLRGSIQQLLQPGGGTTQPAAPEATAEDWRQAWGQMSDLATGVWERMKDGGGRLGEEVGDSVAMAGERLGTFGAYGLAQQFGQDDKKVERLILEQNKETNRLLGRGLKPVYS